MLRIIELMFRVKICGITTVQDALLAAEAGADAIGLNFYSQSPRCIDAQRAEQIVAALREKYEPAQVHVVALFVNASTDDILWTIRDANLLGPEGGLAIQLHGDEPPELLAELQSHGLGGAQHLFHATGHVPYVPVIRALRGREPTLEGVADYLVRCRMLRALPSAVLLDAYHPGSFGGTGQALDWDALRAGRDKLLGLPLILAGGLTSENVAEAIATAQPDGVDVASGVESAPGKKEAAKVLAFTARARQALAAVHPF
jgi:phosphoribosylanthranilate isomerase